MVWQTRGLTEALDELIREELFRENVNLDEEDDHPERDNEMLNELELIMDTGVCTKFSGQYTVCLSIVFLL